MPDSKEYIGKVLLIEDDAELRFILAAHLRACGFEVVDAPDGFKGIEAATTVQPDIIILDLGLPGMDGITVTRTLKANPRTSAIPIIILTARTATADVVRGLEAGAQEYLAKPFDVSELIARVRTLHRLANAIKDLDRLNSRLEAEVNAKTRRLQLLYEFMRDLNHAATHDRVLDLLVGCVQESTGARRVSVFLREGESDRLMCRRAVGIDPQLAEQLQIGSAEGIAGQVFRSGKTLSARTYGLPGESDRHYRRDMFLSTPLTSTSSETSDGVIGVLNVTDKADDQPFGAEEVTCIRSIADAAAIALDSVVRRERLEQSVRVLIQTVGHLAEYRDEETTLHLERVSQFARILADALHREGPYRSIVTDDFIDSLVQAAPMHDIGKVGIPDDILTKPGRLTEEEFAIMKTHTEIGRRVLSQALDPAHPVPLLQMCIDIAHGHHERYDGTGYPRRLKGNQIPLSARMIALVDAYDAMTSRRRYKEAKSHERAVQAIRAESGKHFDPGLVEAFLRCADQFDRIRDRNSDVGEPQLALAR